jgi:hypothetical protein
MESYAKESNMSLGKQSALVVDLSEISSKTALKYWTSYVKEHGKLKKNRKADEHYSEAIVIPAISSSKFDLYSKVEDLKGSSRLMVWIDTGEQFLNSDNDASTFKNAKDYIDDFAIYAEKEHVEAMLKAEEKALGGLEKDMKGLGKDKASYEKSIEDAKQKIAENEKKIEENIVAQEEKTTEIENQQSMIEKIKERLSNIGKSKTKM